MTKLEAQKSKPKPKWVEGTKYRCILSASPGYKQGEDYTCYKNSNGLLCLKGSDGFEDICSMLISAFEETSKQKYSPIGVNCEQKT